MALAPLQIYVRQQQWRQGVIDCLNSIMLLQGSGALLTTATSGFGYLPSMPGAPTETPVGTPSGYVPAVVDSATGKLYLYTSGAWAVA